MWKDLENIYKEIFAVTYGAPMDELFTRYMYYKRAKQQLKDYANFMKKTTMNYYAVKILLMI